MSTKRLKITVQPVKEQFFKEMDDLLAAQHNVVFPVVFSTEGVGVWGPEALGAPGTMATPALAACIPSSHTAPPSSGTPTHPRKQREEQSELFQLTRESEVRRGSALPQ